MSTAHSNSATGERALRIALLAVQFIVAGAFLTMGVVKLAMPLDRVIEAMSWMAGAPAVPIRLLGLCEVVAALTLALPMSLPRAARASSSIAIGFTVLMALMGALHLARGELRTVPVNLVLGALAAFVAWGYLTHANLLTAQRGLTRA